MAVVKVMVVTGVVVKVVVKVLAGSHGRSDGGEVMVVTVV